MIKIIFNRKTIWETEKIPNAIYKLDYYDLLDLLSNLSDVNNFLMTLLRKQIDDELCIKE